MAFHNREAEVLRSAVVAGNPSAAAAEAKNLSEEHWTPHLAPAWKANMDAMYEAAEGYTRATNVRGAALAVGNLGLACAGCHQTLGGPKDPPSDPVPAAGMAAHAWAVERLWFGLMAPSEGAWLQGARLLAKAAIVRSDVPEIDGEAKRLQELGARAEGASGTQRAVAFGELLNTCAACHRRVGLERP
jgi:cytochrome c553